MVAIGKEGFVLVLNILIYLSSLENQDINMGIKMAGTTLMYFPIRAKGK